jgi:hypothetical protein
MQNLREVLRWIYAETRSGLVFVGQGILVSLSAPFTVLHRRGINFIETVAAAAVSDLEGFPKCTRKLDSCWPHGGATCATFADGSRTVALHVTDS